MLSRSVRQAVLTVDVKKLQRAMISDNIVSYKTKKSVSMSSSYPCFGIGAFITSDLDLLIDSNIYLSSLFRPKVAPPGPGPSTLSLFSPPQDSIGSL